ncbi:MAG: hypothetical protein L0Y67_04260 [Gammaproteobacteria bacterium]|nr:hypothetical protein [Gammaproteobacteria bacterium]
MRDLARLHAVLLPTSAVSLLGQRFLERFYYTILPREGLIFGTVAYVDDQAAGFAVATRDSTGFMRTALARWWPYLAWIVGTSVIVAPTSARAVWQVLRVMRKQHPLAGDAQGEILSLGVLPVYREPRFIRESGLQISTDLLDRAVAQLSATGVREIRALVRADNTQTKLFYSGLGWTLNRTDVVEWRTPTVEFVWRG